MNFIKECMVRTRVGRSPEDYMVGEVEAEAAAL